MRTGEEHSNGAGIVLILTAVLVLSSMDAIVKLIIEGGISVIQMLAMRSWIVVPLLLVWLLMKDGWHNGLVRMKTAHPKLHFLRVLFGFGTPFLFFTSLETLSLAEGTVIFFASTFIMTALSVPLLKEQVGVHRWGAIVVGFIGIVIVVNPVGMALNIGVFYALGAAVSYSMMMVITRKIGSQEGTFKLLFYFHLWISLVSTGVLFSGIGGIAFQTEVAALFSPGADPFALVGWGGIIAITLLVIVGHFCMMRAFSIAPVGLIAPFEYSAILWSTLYGYLIWHHVPGVNFWIGSMVVIASGSYLVYRESRIKKMGRMALEQAVGAPSGPVAVPVPISVSTSSEPGAPQAEGKTAD